MHALDVVGLSKTYGEGPKAVPAIAELTFTVDPGEFLCIVGPSGCGKTTLLKCLSGLLRPTSGTRQPRGGGDRRAAALAGARLPGVQPLAAALADGARQRDAAPAGTADREVRARAAGRGRARGRRADGLRRLAPVAALGRDAAAGRDRACARLPAAAAADGRAVRLGRRTDAGRSRGPRAAGARTVRHHRRLRHARHRRVGLPGRPDHRPDAPSDDRQGDHRRLAARARATRSRRRRCPSSRTCAATSSA